MPLYFCPQCGSEREIWNIIEGNCECGYSISSAIDRPSPYQNEKIQKHTIGINIKEENNWKYFSHVDKAELIRQTISTGSCVDNNYIVVSFDEYIGYNQINPNRRTKWNKVVLFSDPSKVHSYPVDPDKFQGIIWKCKNCGKEYSGECPLKCRDCEKHMWIKDE